MASSRFPGKPLLDLLGMTMIEHVWRRSKMCDEVDEVYIATCDTEILEAAKSFGAKAIMTDSGHTMCMDRVAEAAQNIPSDIVVTVQGDEPLVRPEMLSATIRALKNDSALPAATLAQQITEDEEIDDPNRVKMVWNRNNDVLYISRETIPSVKKSSRPVKHYKMVCIYAMKYDFLMKYGSLPHSNLEEIESIDMLRIVENGYRLGVELIEGEVANIDVPDDQNLVVEMLRRDDLSKFYL